MRYTPATLRGYFAKSWRKIRDAEPSRYARIRAEQWANMLSAMRQELRVAEVFKLSAAKIRSQIAEAEAMTDTAPDYLGLLRKRRIAKLATATVRRERKTLADQISLARLNLADVNWPSRITDLATEGNARLLERIGAQDPELASAIRARVAERNATHQAEMDRQIAMRIADSNAEAHRFIHRETDAWSGRFDDLTPENQSQVQARQVQDWRNGIGSSHSIRNYSDGALVRANGPDLETSQGVRVPLADAERTYRFAKAIQVRAEHWRTNGETHAIGPYRLDVVNESGIIAGCHRISWREIDSFAQSMGWNQANASVNPEVQS
jgi:hypothetical protein